tara:strand:+ start:1152 stop:1805 length:654 start_codon:yes stop_codon:yes gene_type:complete
MASEWKKTTIEIESVTLSGSAFASSSEGNVFVPARMIEVSDVREGDIIFATLRENYPDKKDIAPWLCARLHIDHPESVMPDETDEEAPQSPPPHVASNVVPLVRGTELIDAARDQMFLILLGLTQPELNDLVLDVVHHEACTTEDILFSILSVNSTPKEEVSKVERSAHDLIQKTIETLYDSGKILKATYTSCSEGSISTELITYSTTQRANDETFF